MFLSSAGSRPNQARPPSGAAEKPCAADYEGGLLYLILATALCFLMYPYFDLANLIMVYLLAVLVTAVQCGRGPAILNSLLSVLAFDFCFVPPRWTFTVEDAKYIVTFVVMFLVAVVISHLAALIRRQAEAARLQERQTAAMYALSRQLASTRGVETILQVAVEQISRNLRMPGGGTAAGRQGKLSPAAGDLSAVFQKDIVKELDVARSGLRGRAGGGLGDPKPTGLPHSLCPPAGAATTTMGFWPCAPRIRKPKIGCCPSNCACACWSLWPNKSPWPWKWSAWSRARPGRSSWAQAECLSPVADDSPGMKIPPAPFLHRRVSKFPFDIGGFRGTLARGTPLRPLWLPSATCDPEEPQSMPACSRQPFAVRLGGAREGVPLSQ